MYQQSRPRRNSFSGLAVLLAFHSGVVRAFSLTRENLAAFTALRGKLDRDGHEYHNQHGESVVRTNASATFAVNSIASAAMAMNTTASATFAVNATSLATMSINATASATFAVNATLASGVNASMALDASEEAQACVDIEPPADWMNPSCESQATKTHMCEMRRNGTRNDGFCQKTCGLCKESVAMLNVVQPHPGRPPNMHDLPALKTWCEGSPYHISYEKVAYRMSAFNEGENLENATRIYHLHTPKVAGTSFAKDLRDLLPPGVRVDSHEGCYADVEDAVLGVVMMMRSPRQHVLSQYSFCSTSPDRGPSRMRALMPATFDDWIREWVNLSQLGNASGNFTTGPKTAYNDPWCFSTLPFGCYSPIDLQAQRLTCSKAYDYPDKMDMELAIVNLDKAFFVGIVEAYQESICLLHYKVRGTPLPEWCDCQNVTAWNAAPVHQDDHGAHHHGLDSVPQDVLEHVDQLTMTDRVLYELAVDRFSVDVRDVEMSTGMKIMCKELPSSA